MPRSLNTIIWTKIYLSKMAKIIIFFFIYFLKSEIIAEEDMLMLFLKIENAQVKKKTKPTKIIRH